MTNQFNQLIEYLKIHKISLEQDIDELEEEWMDFDNDWDKEEQDDLLKSIGQVELIEHILQEFDKGYTEGV